MQPTRRVSLPGARLIWHRWPDQSMDTWQVIVVALLGNSAVVTVLAFIGKKVTDQVLSRDIERFKRDLHSKAASEIERFRATLQLSTIEHKSDSRRFVRSAPP
jgi:hypothetical protein